MEERKTAADETTTANLTDDAKVQRNPESANNSDENQQKTSEISSLQQDIMLQSRKCGETDNWFDKANTSEGFRCGIFTIKTFNQVMRDAKLLPDPKPLWLSLWYEGEVCCLFAETGVGKSIYAVQVASAIAKSMTILYFDFELSEKQFEVRYRNEHGEFYRWPEKLCRVNVTSDCYENDNINSDVIKLIEDAALKTEAKIIIIDNVTWLCNEAEDGELAGLLMKNIMRFKHKYGWSVLLLAHTPKRDLSKSANQNDLAGSKRFINFFDSAFFVGFSKMGNDYRYIKEIKPSRMGKLSYGADNVITAQIVKSNDGFTHFKTIGYSTESEHLQQATRHNKDNRDTANSKSEKLQKAFAKIFKTNKDGIGYRELARLLTKEYGYKADKDSGISKSAKDRISEGLTDNIICKKDDKYYLSE